MTKECEGAKDLELQQLRRFQLVARLGNMSRAAGELFITQPNLSRSIARLEQELGVSLFYHRKGKIELTEAGRQFLVTVGQALDILDQGRRSLLQEQEGQKRQLSIGCMHDDAEWMTAFASRHRDIALRQYRKPLRELEELLLNRSIEIAVTVLPPRNERLAFEKLYESEYVIVMPTGHPLTAKPSLEIEDLDRLPFILDDTRSNKKLFSRTLRDFGVTFNVAYEVSHADLLYGLVDQGLGVTVLPIVHFAKTVERLPGLNLTYRRVTTKGFRKPFWGVAFRRDYEFTKEAALCRDFFRSYMELEAQLLDRLPGWEQKMPDGGR